MSDGNRSDVQQRLAELNDNVRKASLRGAWQREGRTREPGANPLGLALERYPPQHHRGR